MRVLYLTIGEGISKLGKGMEEKFLSGLKLVSKPSETRVSFQGPLIQYKVVQRIDRNKGTISFWNVSSQGKRSTLVRYLWGKLLWDELNSLESKVFWSLSEVTKDLTIYLGLKALALGTSKRNLRNRLKNSPFIELKYISRQQYLSISGMVEFTLDWEEFQLQKVTKYSGYTKHYKDKGSLAPERIDYYSEILDPVSDISEEIFLRYLTVGEIPLFVEKVVLHPDEIQKDRNGTS